MAYNWSQFPKHDKLNHNQALADQRDRIKREFAASKNKAFALDIENALNELYYGNGRNIKAGYENLSKTEQMYYDKVVEAADRILQEKFNSYVGLNTFNLGVNSRHFSVGTKKGHRIKTIKDNLDKLEAEVEQAKSDGQLTIKQANKKLQAIENFRATLQASGKTEGQILRASDSLGDQYNKLVNQILVDDYCQELGYAAEAAVALLQNNVDEYANKTTDDLIKEALSNMVGGAESGTQAFMNIDGIDSSIYDKYIKSGDWKLDEHGGRLIYKQKTADKADVRMTFGSPQPYYASIKNYYKGDSADIHFSGDTHLASLFSSSLVLERYSRAFLRYAGWKWGVGNSKAPYSETELIRMAQKLIAILAISGKGFQTSPAELLIINRRDKPGFRCYSVQDIADKFLSTWDTSSIKITNFPSREGFRGQGGIRSAFLDTTITVNINNLKKLMNS